MTSVIHTIRGSAAISEQDARAALELLVPILSFAPHDQDAIGSMRSVVGRIDSPCTIRMLADWWLVIECGENPITADVYHPPEHLNNQLREALLAILHAPAIGTRAEWLRAARGYSVLIGQLQDHLDLDHYGPVKLAAERPAWDALVERYSNVIEAVRSGLEAPAVEDEVEVLHKSLLRSPNNPVAKGSRRWNEMTRRAEQLRDLLQEITRLQRLTRLWEGREVPPVVAFESLGIDPDDQLARMMVSSITGEPVPVDASDLAAVLERTAAATDNLGRTLLARLIDQWIHETGTSLGSIPSMEPILRQLASLRRERERLTAASIDVTAIDVALLDDDLEAATAAAIELDAERRRAQGRDKELNRISRLLTKVSDSTDATEIIQELHRLMESLSAADDTMLEEIGTRVTQIEHARLDVARNEHIVRLNVVHADLERLEAPTELLEAVADSIARLNAGEAPERVAIDRFDSFIESRASELVRETKRLLDDTTDLLEATGDSLQTPDRDDFDSRLQTGADTFGGLTEPPNLDELIALRSDLLDLAADIERQRVRRWRLHDGEEQLVSHIVEYCTQQLSFAESDITKFYVALKSKPFVILAGLTGTGKSTIVRLFAESIGARSVDDGFRRIAVRPDWIDQSEVIGFVNPLNQYFEPGWLAEVLQRCHANPDRLYVRLLDEMNLAPVEQYLAEFLSAGEEYRSGSTDVRIPLYGSGVTPRNSDAWPSSLPFPSNLIVVGTVNMDETTRVLSERVLDRANVIQLSVDVNDDHHGRNRKYVQPWIVPAAEWRQLVAIEPTDQYHSLLIDLATILRTEMGIGLGVRAHVEIERFVANASSVLDPTEALDLALLQRLIPKIRGFKRDLVDGLTQLLDEFENAQCNRCANIVSYWLTASVSDDEYLDGTAARVGLMT